MQGKVTGIGEGEREGSRRTLRTLLTLLTLRTLLTLGMLPALVGLEFAAGDGDALGGDHAEGAVGEMVDLHGVHGAGDVGGFSGGQRESPASKLVGCAVGEFHGEGGSFLGEVGSGHHSAGGELHYFAVETVIEFLGLLHGSVGVFYCHYLPLVIELAVGGPVVASCGEQTCDCDKCQSDYLVKGFHSHPDLEIESIMPRLHPVSLPQSAPSERVPLHPLRRAGRHVASRSRL